MNIIEKILQTHTHEKSLSPGQLIDVSLDYIMSNDACTNYAIDIFKDQLGDKQLFRPEQVIFIMDHYTPSSSIDAANTHNKMREFAKEKDVGHLYDGSGICHQIMLERHVQPGQIIIGADSHTCTYGALGALSTGMGSTDIAISWKMGSLWMKVPHTLKFNVTGKWPQGVSAKDLILKIIGDISPEGATYKAMFFDGPVIEGLSVSERAVICSMAVEAGAKFAYMRPNNQVREFLAEHNRKEYPEFTEDPEAEYEKVLQYDVGRLSPLVACPPDMGNIRPVEELEGMPMNEMFIGSCTNGRLEDLKTVAEILKGKKVSPETRLLVTPASSDIYKQAAKTGILEILMESGAMISNPGCSACFGGSCGILGKGEKLLSTANRNFKARVGSPDSEIYITSPAVVAASAIFGKITDPRRLSI